MSPPLHASVSPGADSKFIVAAATSVCEGDGGNRSRICCEMTGCLTAASVRSAGGLQASGRMDLTAAVEELRNKFRSTMFRVMHSTAPFSSSQVQACLSEPVSSTRHLTFSAATPLENATYNWPWEKTGVGRYIPRRMGMLWPWHLLMVIAQARRTGYWCRRSVNGRSLEPAESQQIRGMS